MISTSIKGSFYCLILLNFFLRRLFSLLSIFIFIIIVIIIIFFILHHHLIYHFILIRKLRIIFVQFFIWVYFLIIWGYVFILFIFFLFFILNSIWWCLAAWIVKRFITFTIRRYILLLIVLISMSITRFFLFFNVCKSLNPVILRRVKRKIIWREIWGFSLYNLLLIGKEGHRGGLSL